MGPISPQEMEAEMHQMNEDRHALYIALPFVLLAFAASLYWHHRSQNRPGGAPMTLLAKVFPGPAIMQVGRIHLAAVGLQVGQQYRIIICGTRTSMTAQRLVESTFAGLDHVPPLLCSLHLHNGPLTGLSVVDCMITPRFFEPRRR